MIPIQGKINAEVIERELAQLWQQTTRAELRKLEPGDERVTMRARVANLMIYVSNEEALNECNEILAELSTRHPCRALVMVGEKAAADRDIEIFVNSFCRPGAEKSFRKLSCEEVNLNAHGRFVVELPSVAIPLLVPDLPVFLWWRNDLETDDVFAGLVERADRVIIDSADFRKSGFQMSALASLVKSPEESQAGFSDLNWARLTSWRASVAGFFDTAPNRAALDQIVSVRLEYAAGDAGAIASQPMLIAGWLADRLNWKVIKPAESTTENSQTVSFDKEGRQIVAEFLEVEPQQLLPGRLARVTLATEATTTFEVTRSPDGLYLESRINDERLSNRARVSQSHTRSVADLLSGEMDILGRDRVWEAAVQRAAEIAG